MDLVLDFPLTTLFVLGVTVWVASRVVRWRRAGTSRRVTTGDATCPRCGATIPPVARFCRNCGHEAAR